MMAAVLLLTSVRAHAEYAIDGDTLDAHGQRWRLAAIDTPERGEPFYAVAKRRLAELVAGGVSCRNTGERPSHGRLIGICESGGRDVSLLLVEEGLAAACHQRPESSRYLEAEIRAQAARRGIWRDGRYVRKSYCRG